MDTAEMLPEDERSFALDWIDTASSQDLDMIQNAVNARRSELKARALEQLKPGDKIITHDMSPRYLDGLICTVVKAGIGTAAKPRIQVRLDKPEWLDPRGRKYVRADGTMNVLLSTVRPIS